MYLQSMETAAAVIDIQPGTRVYTEYGDDGQGREIKIFVTAVNAACHFGHS